jgi:hypothetical protein
VYPSPSSSHLSNIKSIKNAIPIFNQPIKNRYKQLKFPKSEFFKNLNPRKITDFEKTYLFVEGREMERERWCGRAERQRLRLVVRGEWWCGRAEGERWC